MSNTPDTCPDCAKLRTLLQKMEVKIDLLAKLEDGSFKTEGLTAEELQMLNEVAESSPEEREKIQAELRALSQYRRG